jgi:hypothetical protein
MRLFAIRYSEVTIAYAILVKRAAMGSKPNCADAASVYSKWSADSTAQQHGDSRQDFLITAQCRRTKSVFPCQSQNNTASHKYATHESAHGKRHTLFIQDMV